MIRRRDFIKKVPVFSAISLFSIPWFGSCAKSSDSTAAPAPNPSCSSNGAIGAVANTGHAHPSIAVSAADVMTATQKTYTITAGTSGHVHSVTVAAANFVTLQSNTSIILTSDTDGTGHTHSVTVTCA